MPKRFLPVIDGRRVRLRPLEEADLPRTLAWRNQPQIRRWFVHSAEITPPQHGHWFRSYAQRDDDYVFIIEETQDLGKPVGQLALYRVDRERKEAEFGRLMIGEADAAGRGLAREAVPLLLEFGHRDLGLERFVLEVYPENTRAIAIYEQCGFTRVGQRDGMLVMERVVGADDPAPPRPDPA